MESANRHAEIRIKEQAELQKGNSENIVRDHGSWETKLQNLVKSFMLRCSEQ
jgi:hypothetical protein